MFVPDTIIIITSKSISLFLSVISKAPILSIVRCMSYWLNIHKVDSAILLCQNIRGISELVRHHCLFTVNYWLWNTQITAKLRTLMRLWLVYQPTVHSYSVSIRKNIGSVGNSNVLIYKYKQNKTRWWNQMVQVKPKMNMNKYKAYYY